jgi:hypothetical protein
LLRPWWSVGWFGAVAAFLALAVAGIASDNAQIVRSAYLMMELITWTVIVPFSIATLVLTVVATVLLLVHAQAVGQVASLATERTLSMVDVRALRIQLIADAGAAMMALVVATTLSVYKPAGLTSYGRRMAFGDSARTLLSNADAVWTKVWLAGLVAAITLFALLHLSGAMHHY